MGEIEKVAQNYLASHSLNWRLGLDIYNSLIAHDVDRDLCSKVLKRVVEIKPVLVKKLKLDDPELKSIMERHSSIVLDEFAPGAYYMAPVIKDMAQLDLEVFSVLSSECQVGQADFITRDSFVFGFGSCFAVNFINYMARLGIRSASSILSEDINSPRNNFHLLDWVLNDKENHVTTQIFKLNPEFDKTTLVSNMKNASHIVLTLGTVFHLARKAPDGTWSPTLVPSPGATTVASSIGELHADIRGILEMVRNVNPAARIFLTVSPIPLLGILHKANPVVANTFSKSMLRAAVEGIRGLGLFKYLPIYDAIIGLSPVMDFAAFGKDDGNPRHLNGGVVDSVMRQVTNLLVKAEPPQE